MVSDPNGEDENEDRKGQEISDFRDLVANEAWIGAYQRRSRQGQYQEI
jgi:hypothetical protein